MTVVRDFFIGRTNETEYDIEVSEWLRESLRNAKCAVCGDLVLDRKAFLWWSADSNIILCRDCAEHTIDGLSRDLAELKGDKEAKGKTGDRYSPILLKQEVSRLQGTIQKNLRRIVQLENILARPD